MLILCGFLLLEYVTLYIIYYTGAALRIGKDSFIDNYSAGGFVLSIDLKTGTAKAEAENKLGERFSVHPVTGVRLDCFAVPLWQQVLDMVFDMACTYKLNYVAWDIAILEDTVSLIEANPAGMINTIQIADGGPKKKIYKDLFKEWKNCSSKSGTENCSYNEYHRVLL